MPCERKRLTDRQQEIFEYVWLHSEQHGYSPTVREICRQFGYASANAAYGHLRALRRKGYLTWQSGKCRTVRPAGALEGNL